MNLSSIHGRIPTGPRAPLTTVTAAISAFSDALRLSMAKWGVDVIVIEAGSTTTGISQYIYGILLFAIIDFFHIWLYHTKYHCFMVPSIKHEHFILLINQYAFNEILSTNMCLNYFFYKCLNYQQK